MRKRERRDGDVLYIYIEEKMENVGPWQRLRAISQELCCWEAAAAAEREEVGKGEHAERDAAQES